MPEFSQIIAVEIEKLLSEFTLHYFLVKGLKFLEYSDKIIFPQQIHFLIPGWKLL